MNKLIYNTIFQLTATLTNVVGTAYAILSILKLKPSDLYDSLTLEGLDKNDKTLLTQKKQARIGISLVVYAWFIQAAFSFVEVKSVKMFVGFLFAYILISVILCICLSISNKKFERKYIEHKESKEKEGNNKHIDCHSWQDF